MPPADVIASLHASQPRRIACIVCNAGIACNSRIARIAVIACNDRNDSNDESPVTRDQCLSQIAKDQGQITHRHDIGHDDPKMPFHDNSPHTRMRKNTTVLVCANS